MWAAIKKDIGVKSRDGKCCMVWPPASAAEDRGVVLSGDGAEASDANVDFGDKRPPNIINIDFGVKRCKC